MEDPNPAQPRSSVIQVKGIDVAYNGQRVLHDIHCHFDKHRVTAIMGPSGSGKSTLVKALNRTLELTPSAEVTAGEVCFHGRNIYDNGINAMEIRKRIGIIHQRPIPFPMSILDNVLFGARFHGLSTRRTAREYAEQYLHQVGLLDEVKDRLSESANRLSGGQQQRLCLARTLANQPEVILMDEPCSSIDPAGTKRIEDLIAKLKERYTIIIVTHNMSQAKRLSEHVLFIFGGVIVEAGEASDVFSSPQAELTDQFINGIIG